jgi:hypothetical protein
LVWALHDFLSSQPKRRHVSGTRVTSKNDDAAKPVSHQLRKHIARHRKKRFETYAYGSGEVAPRVADTLAKWRSHKAPCLPGHFDGYVFGLDAVRAKWQVSSMFFNAAHGKNHHSSRFGGLFRFVCA